MSYRPPPSAALLRRRPVRSLLSPLRERRFTYEAYGALLDRLRQVRVVPLRELEESEGGALPVVGLRHDVDSRLESALVLARMEAGRGLRATYFVLHTAPYYDRSTGLAGALRELQELGHEVGLHSDLVTLELARGLDPRWVLARELEWLRREGLEIVGVAGHGSYEARKHGFLNHLFFSDLPARAPRFPNNDVGLRGEKLDASGLTRGTLSEFGLRYDADFLDNDSYVADSYFDERGRRWHPDGFDPSYLPPGSKAILLTHPCHWDASLPAKVGRVWQRGGSALLRRGGSEAE